jgi:hypothetical protein
LWIRADKFLVRFLNRLYTSFTANSSHTGCCNLPDLTYRYLFHGLALLCNFQLFVYYQNCLSRLDRGGVGRLLLLLFLLLSFAQHPYSILGLLISTRFTVEVQTIAESPTAQESKRLMQTSICRACFQITTFVFEMSKLAARKFLQCLVTVEPSEA